MNAITHLIEGWWWLIFIFGGTVSGSVRQALRHHHKRRLDIIAAKADLAESRNAALRPAPDPQPVCGCSHHLSFHNPVTSACAVDDCRCQQYVGPEPLGHVMALPIVDPERMAAEPMTTGPTATEQHRPVARPPAAQPPVLGPDVQT